jgi:hypothetical protein
MFVYFKHRPVFARISYLGRFGARGSHLDDGERLAGTLFAHPHLLLQHGREAFTCARARGASQPAADDRIDRGEHIHTGELACGGVFMNGKEGEGDGDGGRGGVGMGYKNIRITRTKSHTE